MTIDLNEVYYFMPGKIQGSIQVTSREYSRILSEGRNGLLKEQPDPLPLLYPSAGKLWCDCLGGSAILINMETHDNQSAFGDLYLHDALIQSIDVEYGEAVVRMDLEQPLLHSRGYKRFQLVFKGYKLFLSKNLEPWGPGDQVLGQDEGMTGNWSGVEILPFEEKGNIHYYRLLLKSGDEIYIIAESFEYVEK